MAAAGYVLWPKPERSSSPAGRLSVTGIMADADTAGFARATAPRMFSFPADHGPHLDFKTEWWYYTGNLTSEGGRQFGFQLTFFRSALAPGIPYDFTKPNERTGPPVSRWRAHHIYMGHFGLSDINGRKFYHFERFSRSAANRLAGAEVMEPYGYQVWLDDWSVTSLPPNQESRNAHKVLLKAADGGAALTLTLRSLKPPVLQGNEGLSQKGASAGNASYYYAMTRLAADGTVSLPDGEIGVTGSAWLDREWSTSALEPDQAGWDWFALQLSDSTEIMFYQLRRRDGTADPHSRGSRIDQQGYKQDLYLEDVQLEVLARWDSPRGGTYPSRWRMAVASQQLDLIVIPLLADQELDLSFRYWEGAVQVNGTHGGRPISGYGYVEMTGYAD